MKKTEFYTFFWKDKDCFSNWHPSKIEYGGITFNCSEQLYMYRKAIFFNDVEIAHEIVATKSPREQKALGRKVKNFDATSWNEVAKDIMYEVNKLKYEQNEKLMDQLLQTDDTEIVEASPYDKIWGIGMDENHPNVEDKTKWEGTNWLGEVLTSLREDIKDGI